MIADELVPCCNCKKPMYEKAEECPHCGTHYTYIVASCFDWELGTYTKEELEWLKTIHTQERPI